MVPDRAAADSQVITHIPLSELRGRDGASELETAWIELALTAAEHSRPGRSEEVTAAGGERARALPTRHRRAAVHPAAGAPVQHRQAAAGHRIALVRILYRDLRPACPVPGSGAGAGCPGGRRGCEPVLGWSDRCGGRAAGGFEEGTFRAATPETDLIHRVDRGLAHIVTDHEAICRRPRRRAGDDDRRRDSRRLSRACGYRTGIAGGRARRQRTVVPGREPAAGHRGRRHPAHHSGLAEAADRGGKLCDRGQHARQSALPALPEPGRLPGAVRRAGDGSGQRGIVARLRRLQRRHRRSGS